MSFRYFVYAEMSLESDLKYNESGEFKQAFYAKLLVGRDDSERAVMMENSHGPTTFDAYPSDILKIEIYTKHRIRRNNFKGATPGETVGVLSDFDDVISRNIYKHDAAGTALDLSRSICFNIQGPKSSEAMPEPGKCPSLPSYADAANTKSLETAKKAKMVLEGVEPAPWLPLLAKVEKFNALMAELVEVHPYAKLAWGVLSAVSKFMVDQMNRDEHIKQLVLLLDDVFAFLGETSQLNIFFELTSNRKNDSSGVQFDTQIRILILLSRQVTECAHFIHDYSKDENYWKRTIKHTVSDVDSKIEEYEKIFHQLKSDFADHAILHIQISVLQVKFSTQSALDKLDNIAMDLAIDKIVHAPGARYNPDKGCLPNTRQAIIDEIVEWANKPATGSNSQIFWLSGVAGSGKSAIAHTVAQRLQAMNRLGSSFCFDVASQAVRGPQHLFGTLARDLGNWDHIWKQALWNILKENPSLQSSLSVTEQFESFLLKPSKSLKVVGPVVIIIDALDEAGDIQSRKALLSILSKNLAELPSNFRIIITSRPEPDIVRALRPCKYVFSKYMEDIQKESTNKDILQYLHLAISEENRSALDEQWPGQSWYQLLVQKAEGLFQWIVTVCLFIESEFYTPVEQLHTVLQSADQAKNLDALYTTILEQKTSGGDGDKVARFVSVMGTVLSLKKPLPMSSLYKLCYGKDPSVIKSVLQPLGALMSGVSSDSIPIQTLHTSLWNYLMDKNRSGKFYVDISLEYENLVSASLEVMDGLCFNICQLPSSYHKNEDVKDMENRIQQHIPPHLFYACNFWADHLENTDFQTMLCTKLTQFLDSKLLYWLEVLSIMKAVNAAVLSLSKLRSWMETGDVNAAALASDAHKFVATFWPLINDSAPHIYLSALPFAPEKSLVAKNYLQKFRNIPVLTSGKRQDWPEIQNVLGGHKEAVFSVKFSSDGEMILSGSGDKTIRLWNSKSGQDIIPPITGHTGDINDVAFSLDGKYIISGSDDNTVRIWSTETGQPIGVPFKGHSDCVTSIALSPDGKYVVSGSHDKSIKILDINSGQAVDFGKFEGHASEICAIDFSPDGKYIASGSNDGMVHVWGAKTGLPIHTPFKGHAHGVSSVAISPDSNTVASGSIDGTIRIWDIKTGDLAAGPFQRHDFGNHQINSIAFSPDGKSIVSGIDDKTIYVWDVSKGCIVAGPFEGHTASVMAVAYSPDGKLIVSGSDDAKIMVWDATPMVEEVHSPQGEAPDSKNEVQSLSSWVEEVTFSGDNFKIASCSDNKVMVWDVVTGKALWHSKKGQTLSTLNSVKFSPDGKFLVSGSDDGIQSWDVETGDELGRPFKGHTDLVNSIGFSPDGKLVVSGSMDGTIRLWDAVTGLSANMPLEGHKGGVTRVMFSPNGKSIISGSMDKTLILWNVETGAAIAEPFAGHTHIITSVAFSPDGKHIVSGSLDQTIRIWDAQTNTETVEPFKIHTGWVQNVMFSPDGRYIVSSSADETIKITDARTGNVLGTYGGHLGWINSLNMSSDGKWIVSGSTDKTVRIWDVQRLLVPPTDPFPPIAGLSPFEHHFSIVDSWVLGPDKELLFWLPTWNAAIAFSPRNPLVIADKVATLDYSNFVHGSSWMKCRTVI
ncbi:WD40-repeat-containing domain protein [Collybia nuda]|uniref:WD40-repeat-containing domain protein n=1 Tax=Collybia nuda TaxID=64659 RepID=A0A9P5Y082_9AGAR|nr:WD40-repeat-containing domain protein [Collybia nuda]